MGRVFLTVLSYVGHVAIGAGYPRPAVHPEAPRLEVRVLGLEEQDARIRVHPVLREA